MSDWQPIDTAPKDGTIIRLRGDKSDYWHAMSWDAEQGLWTGILFGIMGPIRVTWDEDKDAITRWCPLETLQ